MIVNSSNCVLKYDQFNADFNLCPLLFNLWNFEIAKPYKHTNLNISLFKLHYYFLSYNKNNFPNSNICLSNIKRLISFESAVFYIRSMRNPFNSCI